MKRYHGRANEQGGGGVVRLHTSLMLSGVWLDV